MGVPPSLCGDDMLSEISIPRKCIKCLGSGVWTDIGGSGPIIYDPCPGCFGSGYQEFYKLVLPDGYYWTTDVMNCIVNSEYTALDATQKDFLRLILSLGVCNLATGSNERNLLLSMFGVGTTTRANLIALVS